ncbi:ion transporter [Candidatus Woesearchaeota archaeon]|nr:ion transporter [Candidatus Woesearchaeota archaeon]
MHDFLERLEHFVDRAIPYLLVLLTLLIIAEFTSLVEKYHTLFSVVDYTILAFFVADLVFKWRHTRKIIPFVKLYWIDILAVFPFYLVFRLYFVALEFAAAGEIGQKLLHETALLREAKLIRETELLREARFFREIEAGARFGRLQRILRSVPRFLRLLRARLYMVHGHMHKVSRDYERHHRKR